MYKFVLYLTFHGYFLVVLWSWTLSQSMCIHNFFVNILYKIIILFLLYIILSNINIRLLPVERKVWFWRLLLCRDFELISMIVGRLLERDQSIEPSKRVNDLLTDWQLGFGYRGDSIQDGPPQLNSLKDGNLELKNLPICSRKLRKSSCNAKPSWVNTPTSINLLAPAKLLLK